MWEQWNAAPVQFVVVFGVSCLPLIGTSVHFLYDKWEQSVKRAERNLSWPKVKDTLLS